MSNWTVNYQPTGGEFMDAMLASERMKMSRVQMEQLLEEERRKKAAEEAWKQVVQGVPQNTQLPPEMAANWSPADYTQGSTVPRDSPMPPGYGTTDSGADYQFYQPDTSRVPNYVENNVPAYSGNNPQMESRSRPATSQEQLDAIIRGAMSRPELAASMVGPGSAWLGKLMDQEIAARDQTSKESYREALGASAELRAEKSGGIKGTPTNYYNPENPMERTLVMPGEVPPDGWLKGDPYMRTIAPAPQPQPLQTVAGGDVTSFRGTIKELKNDEMSLTAKIESRNDMGEPTYSAAGISEFTKQREGVRQAIKDAEEEEKAAVRKRNDRSGGKSSSKPSGGIPYEAYRPTPTRGSVR